MVCLNNMKKQFTLKGKYTYSVYKDGKLLRTSPVIENLIVLNNDPAGLYIILDRMLGINTHEIEITSAEIGTGEIAPAITDTDLGNMVLDDIPVALKSREADDEIKFVFFINNTELANGSYTEFGLRMGTQLFARSIISPTFTKAEGEDFRLDYSITASSVEVS